ncbi:MAG: response regulator transcription factor [Thiotrichaceae bacterium]|nr:response regulator transcription factor [Thiotrichaceae bacterium]
MSIRGLSLVRLLIVDDQLIVQEGIKRLITSFCDNYQVDSEENGSDALALLDEIDYDMAILEIDLPDMSGLEVLKKLRAKKRQLPILILSVYPEDVYAVRALRAGAQGYLCKSSAPGDLEAAIGKLLTGGRYVSSTLAEKIAYALDEVADKAPHEGLSNREYEVLCSIGSGNSVSEIAREFSLSVKTVSTYRARILKKMKMRHNAELTHYVIKQGLIK